MTITLEAFRAAGGIVHSDGNIFFRDISMLQGLAGAAPAAVAGPACEDRAAWFALAMGAAASLEDAANCLRDKDAKKAAMGAATHVRESCNKLWWSVPALEAPVVDPGDLVAVPRDLIGSACAAIDKKRDAPKTLSELRRYTTGDLSRALEAPAHQCCNSWFLSLPEGRQAVLRENQWMLADAAYQAGRESSRALEAPAAPVTLMTEDQASRWAWDQIREEVGTKGWTAGDSSNFFGFFLHGWNYRGQYELQRPAALARAALAAAPQAPAAPVVWNMREEFIAWAEVAYRHEDEFSKRDFEICLKAWQFGGASALLAAQAAPAAPSAKRASKPVATLEVLENGCLEYETCEAGWLLPEGLHRLYSHPAAPAAPAVDACDDTALLDAMERERIAVIPEFEGPWDAQIFGEDEAALACGSGATPREAITEALASLEARKAHDAAQAKEGGAQ